MEHTPYEALRLENQLCFPLYACSREIIKNYRPYLDALDLTYTQYITMMVIWAEGTVSVRDLCKRLYLDSGTLTPVLKHLEQKGFIHRRRCPEDERVLLVDVTKEGLALRERAVDIPAMLADCVSLDQQEAQTLYRLLYKLLGVEISD
ncbi:MAG: MarR family transcriptional regulator [Clostridia bacterium]|nr:MarR family transcriptional regulator [Clostridia bacterium]